MFTQSTNTFRNIFFFFLNIRQKFLRKSVNSEVNSIRHKLHVNHIYLYVCNPTQPRTGTSLHKWKHMCPRGNTNDELQLAAPIMLIANKARHVSCTGSTGNYCEYRFMSSRSIYLCLCDEDSIRYRRAILVCFWDVGFCATSVHE